MMIQLAMHAGYDELKICIIGKLPESLSELRWLPHTWDDDKNVHLIAKNTNELSKLIPVIDKFLSDHKPQSRGAEAAKVRRNMLFLLTEPGMSQSGMVTRMLFNQPYERVHIMIGLIDNLCHEVIYHKHDHMNYDVMTDLVVENILNLFKKDLN